MINNTGSGPYSIGVTIDASTAAVAHTLALNSSALADYGSLSLAGVLTLSNAYLVMVGGSVTAQSIFGGTGFNEIYGHGIVNSNLSSNVYVYADGGSLVLNGNVNSSFNGLYIDANSSLEIVGSGSGYVYFNGSQATLQLDAPTSFSANIQGVELTDTIDLRGLVATSVSYSGSTLTVGYGANQSLSYSVSGSLTGDTVAFASDGHGGTAINWAAGTTSKNWTGGAGGWSVASNWGGSLPVSSSDVVINNTGSGPYSIGVTIDASTGAVAHSLALNSSALADYGSLSLAGSLTLSTAYLIMVGGSVTAQSISGGTGFNEIYGHGIVNSNLSSNVYVYADGGSLVLNGNVNSSFNGLYIDANSSLEIVGSGSGYVYFNGSQATLQLDAPTSFSANIQGVELTDTIDLRGLVATSVSYSGSTLTVGYGANQSLSYSVSGSLTGDTVAFASDGHGGTNITWAAGTTSKYWTGSAGGWSVASNWGSSLPDSSSDAVINNTGSGPYSIGVTIDASTAAVAHTLALNSSALADYGSLSLAGVLTLSNAYLVMVGGSVTAQSIFGGTGFNEIYGHGIVNSNLSSNVYVYADGGSLVLNGNVNSSFNGLYIDANSSLEIVGSGSGYVYFNGSQATLQLDAPTSFSANIQGVELTDTIDLRGLVATSVSYSGSTLTVGYGANQSLSYSVSGSLTGDTVAFASDGHGGTNITWSDTIFHAVADFNGDGHSDLLWRNSSSGMFSTWQITGTTTLQDQPNVYVNGSVDTGWALQGSFDFNGDGKADLIWRNVSSGAFSIWSAASNGAFSPNTYASGAVDTGWSLAGLGDFNGDGKDDLLWRNASGTFTIWSSTGTGFTPNTYVDAGVDSSWHLQAAADFNGDGKADLLWRNSSGIIAEWQSNGLGFTENVVVNASVDTTWHIAAVADFNGDGKSDLLWRSDNGTFTEWQSNGLGFIQNVFVSAVDPNWSIVEAADFNGDGKADLVWRNAQTGVMSVWESNGNGFVPNVLVENSVNTQWQLITHHYDIV